MARGGEAADAVRGAEEMGVKVPSKACDHEERSKIEGWQLAA